AGGRVGRSRRADHLRGASSRAQRHRGCHRDAPPHVPAARCRPDVGVKDSWASAIRPMPKPSFGAYPWRRTGGHFAGICANGDTAMTRTPIDRRKFLRTTMAATATAAIASPAVRAQGGGPRVIVIGGGFGGAACARALRKADARLAVTLVEQSRI